MTESSLKDMIELLASIVSNGHTECSDMLDCCVHHYVMASVEDKEAFFAFANWDVWSIPPSPNPPIAKEQYREWFPVFLNLIESEMTQRLKLADPFPEIKEKRMKEEMSKINQ